MVEIRDISHSYGQTRVLDSVSLNIAPGRMLALLGPNGAGKSTLLRIVAAELKPDSGTVTFSGVDMFRLKVRGLAKRRALLPQESQLDFPFSVEEVVMLGRAPHIERSESDKDARIVNDALAMTGMSAFATREYTSLSGGERQRVQLARVLAQTWDRAGALLLLDEPVASLDPEHQHDTLNIARKWAAAGAAVVAILHDVNLALRYADDAVLLKDGRVVADGYVREVLDAKRVSEVFNVDARCVEEGNGEPPVLVLSAKV